MLSNKENIKLESIGIHLTRNEINCYRQGGEKVLIHQIPQVDIASLKLSKTEEGEFSVRQLFGWMIGHNKDESIHAARIYRLEFILKNNQKKSVNLSNIDVIGIQRIIKKLNTQFSNVA